MRADTPHEDVQALLDQMDELEVFPLKQYGPEGAREFLAEMRPDDIEKPPVGDVTDRTIPGLADDDPDIPVRIYTPDGDGPFPTVVFFHGGGYVIGDLESHDVLCREVVRESGCVVMATDYRLAPEHPFPGAVEDAYAATEWAAAHTDDLDGDGSLAVMGDSAGGNLSAAVTLMARDHDGPAIDFQALVYPAVSASEDWDSYAENAEGYYLTAEDMEWFSECYYGSIAHDANPYAHPLVACDHAGLPPASIVTAGFDPLRDQGVAYAEALDDAGVDVTHRNYADMIHGFFSMLSEPTELDSAHDAVEAVAADLSTALA